MSYSKTSSRSLQEAVDKLMQHTFQQVLTGLESQKNFLESETLHYSVALFV